MTTPRGGAIVLTSGLLGLAVLAAAGFAFRARIAEGYWLWKLERGPEGDRETAARRLGELRSVRAVPGILKWVVSTGEEGNTCAIVLKDSDVLFLGDACSSEAYQMVSASFRSMGAGAVPQLAALSSGQSGEPSLRSWAEAMLGELEGKTVVHFLTSEFKP